MNMQNPMLRALEGEWYETQVPDTLDLAERARLGLNYFTEIISEKLGYEMYCGSNFEAYRPPILTPHVTALGACQSKAMEAMCYERLMSGSQQNLEREASMMEMLVSLLGEDGLQWVRADVTKKPWMQIAEPFVMVHGQGIIEALLKVYNAKPLVDEILGKK